MATQRPCMQWLLEARWWEDRGEEGSGARGQREGTVWDAQGSAATPVETAAERRLRATSASTAGAGTKQLARRTQRTAAAARSVGSRRAMVSEWTCLKKRKGSRGMLPCGASTKSRAPSQNNPRRAPLLRAAMPVRVLVPLHCMCLSANI